MQQRHVAKLDYKVFETWIWGNLPDRLDGTQRNYVFELWRRLLM